MCRLYVSGQLPLEETQAISWLSHLKGKLGEVGPGSHNSFRPPTQEHLGDAARHNPDRLRRHPEAKRHAEPKAEPSACENDGLANREDVRDEG